MDRISLSAEERKILGKKVKNLRKAGKLPGHVYGKGVETEHVSVDGKIFLKTFQEAGETGLIDLKISKLAANAVEAEKVRPVLVRGVQYDPITGLPLHIDFYQVNLSQKVKVPVPLILKGEEPERVHLGEAIVLQTLNEVEVEALPGDLVENIEVDKSLLKEIDDAITVGELAYDREKLTILADQDEIVVKLAPAVTAEMEQLLEEQAAEAAEAQAEAPAEGEIPVEEAVVPEGEAPAPEAEPPTTEATENKEEAQKE